jgi:hypothetical protein
MSTTNAATFRRRAGATTIIAFFGFLLASTLIEPTDSHSNSVQLKAAVLHSGAMQAAAWCEILAGLLAPVVVLTLMHIVRGRGVVLAHAGGILGILGSVGGALIGLHGLFIVALAGRADAIAVVRGGLAPHWVIPVAVLFLLADSRRCRERKSSRWFSGWSRSAASPGRSSA